MRSRVENVDEHQRANRLIFQMRVHRFAKRVLAPIFGIAEVFACLGNIAHQNGLVHVLGSALHRLNGGGADIDNGVLALGGNLSADRLNLTIRAMQIISHDLFLLFQKFFNGRIRAFVCVTGKLRIHESVVDGPLVHHERLVGVEAVNEGCFFQKKIAVRDKFLPQ